MDSNSLIIPIPLYPSNRSPNFELLPKLVGELERERGKNQCLAMELANLKSKQFELQEYIKGNIKSIPRISSLSEFTDVTDATEDQSPVIGAYSPQVRAQKIMKYKLKIKKYKEKVHVSRDFKGRSQVAKKKLRYKGKFVKELPQV